MIKRIWFKAKRYGWGWQPLTWEGWLTMGVWLGVNVWWFIRVDRIHYSGSDTLINVVPVFIASTLILLAICYTKGEHPHWRWGDA